MLSSVPDVGLPAEEPGATFDPRSGGLIERWVFNHRPTFLAICALLTLLFAWSATKLLVNASFDRLIPQSHPYIKNYFDNRARLGGVGNVVRIVIENPAGDIFAPKFLEATRKINDELFLVPGVDRAWMKSIWMSSVRWTEVTDEGFRGGPVMPESYDGSPRSIETLASNIRTAGIAGNLVGNDFKSIMIVVPLLEQNLEAGRRLDYGEFAQRLEQIRQKHTVAGAGTPIRIKIVGFAKLVGDLIDGLVKVMQYFAAAAVIAGFAILVFTRDVRSTLLVLGCSLVAVVWMLGAIRFLGMELDPYSVLVPFLVFAIGVSHGAQKMNGIMQDIGRGTPKYVAARFTFRRLFLAGLTALMADAVGFGVLVAIDVPVIKQLAFASSIGVAGLIFTNLLLLPVMLSYTGVSSRAAKRSLAKNGATGDGRGLGRLWTSLVYFTSARGAWLAVALAGSLAVIGYLGSLQLRIGDLDPGAPELRTNSRYNRDLAYVNTNYRITNDQFVVIAKTPNDQCANFKPLKEIDELALGLRQLPGVVGTSALSDLIKSAVAGFQEGNPKWYTITRNEALLGTAFQWTSSDNPDAVDQACSTVPIFAYLSDHKAETLERVVSHVEQFARDHNGEDISFLLAAGPAGIEAVTNIVVAQASRTMLLWVYGAVALLCLITFRSWRAAVIALIPLAITSLLCEALMAQLGIGVKVATLPVIALGVGIGVDYALYLLSVQLMYQRAGMSLTEAYRRALAFTGKVVALVGVTLAGGVITWVLSPIKFQADMGILLTFMFLWNMLGALVLVPALSYFLLQTETLNRAHSRIGLAS
ncbi:MAG TPA: MMPL family transporter [Rubrivivax sp.]|nr:MMPL family transporter [Rubrivivax sp.]